MKKLSRATVEIINRLFAPEQQARVGRLLAEECGDNLPFLESQDEHGLEPIRFAVLKLSRGNLLEMEWWVSLAKADWRDVIRAAGFAGSPTAHREWAADVYHGRTSTTPSKT